MSAKNMLDQARQLQREIVELRRYLHQHPELSFAENKTAKLAADKFRELGCQVREGVGGTGVVAELGSGSKIVALRADMDALPILETNKCAYASTNRGVMHACGHDAHVSCLIAAARLLSEVERLPGKIRLIVQPAEENTDADGKSGARRMIEAGVMAGVSAILGLHVDSSLPSGQVSIRSGPIMAACDGFELTILGKGGHGAYPENAVDPVVIAAQIVTALQQIVSRRISALEPAVITIGSIHSSSTRGNVIADNVLLLGSVRSFNAGTRQKLKEEIEQTCTLARSLGGDFTLEYQQGYPATINDNRVSKVMQEVAGRLIGTENLVTLPLKTWSEDFSMYAEIVPGAFMFLGVEMTDYRRSHHSPDFEINESELYTGPAILAGTALELLSSG